MPLSNLINLKLIKSLGNTGLASHMQIQGRIIPQEPDKKKKNKTTEQNQKKQVHPSVWSLAHRNS